jgi:myo-inositol-1(or 4)-monophosphatase
MLILRHPAPLAETRMNPMVNIALRAAREAGELIAHAGDRLDLVKVERKAGNDFVTEVDRASERLLVKHLHKAYPDHGIVGEEGGESFSASSGSEYQWLIDPLDGTTNFIHGIPHFAVSMACLHKGRIEHAVIVDPIRREEYTASRGGGAQLNGRRIRVSQRRSLSESLLGTGIPFLPSQQQYMDAYLDTLKAFAGDCAGIRRAGAATLDLAYVAAGRLDGFWEIGLKPWDIAAGVLLVQEAGGLICDLAGGHDYLDSGNIVAANPKCLKAMLRVIQPRLGSV